MEQKINSADLELKDRLVAINRVTKVTKEVEHSVSAIVVAERMKTVPWVTG